MNSKRKIPVLVFLLLGFSSILSAKNLMKNHGFEKSEDKLVSDWEFHKKSQYDVFYKKGNLIKEYGNAAFQISTDGMGGKNAACISASTHSCAYISQKVPIEADKFYKFTVWVKGENLESESIGSAVHFMFDNGQSAYIDGPKDILNKATTAWLKIGKIIKTPEGAKTVTVLLELYFSRGKVLWSNVKLEKTNPVCDITYIEKPLFKELLDESKPGNYLTGDATSSLYRWEIPDNVVIKKPNWLDENAKELLENKLSHFRAAPDKPYDKILADKGLIPYYWLNFKSYLLNQIKDKKTKLAKSGPSFLHPSYQKWYEELITKWLASIASDPVCDNSWAMFDDEISSELLYPFKNSMPDGVVFQDDVKKECIKEIKEKYGYGKFSAPEGMKGTSFQWIAYRKWAWNKYALFQKRIYDKIKAVKPNMLVSANNFFCIYFLPVWDYGLMGNCDIMISDPYPTQLETRKANSGHFMPGFTTKLIKDISGKPVIYLGQGFVYFDKPVKPEWIQEWASQAFRSGGDGITWYAHRYPYKHGGSTKYADPELWDIMMQVSKTAATMNHVKVPQEADTAILYSTDAYAGKIVEGNTWDKENFEGQEIYSCYALLGQKGKSWFKFIDDNMLENGKTELRKYKNLYIPYGKIEREPVINCIEKFVMDGGNLICGDPLIFEYSPKGDVLDSKRSELFGVKILGDNYEDKILITDNHLFPEIETGTTLSVFSDQHFSSTCKKIKILNNESTILAKFPNGDPAIVLTPKGKGKFIYFAFNPFTPEAIGLPKWIEFFKSLQKSLGSRTDYKIWDFLIPVKFRKVDKWWQDEKNAEKGGNK